MEFENNKMIDLDILDCYFEDNYVYLPIIQRNYKWLAKTPKENPEIHSAEKFAHDLWHSFLNSETVNNRYTVGMITLYSEENEGERNRVQIVDGQQRIITLKLLLKALDKNNANFKLDFERDEGLNPYETRKQFLNYGLGQDQPIPYENTDIQRFTENFKSINEFLHNQEEFEQKKDSFKHYLFHNVFILFHLTNVEPIDEFLNINKNKTRFTISDHIKAQLIIDSSTKDERIQILELFTALSENLFDDTIWNIVSLGYTPKNIAENIRNIQLCYPDENRLKILFSDRYEGNSKLNYEKTKDLQQLFYYERILNTLHDDMDLHNINQSNGFECYYHVNPFPKKYFELLNGQADCSKYFEEVLFEEIKPESIFIKNCFIQSQLSSKTKFDDVQGLKEESDTQAWLSMADELWGNFVEYYESYIDRKYSKVEV
ncbi:DUF262 domain-containing protein [Lysinibacillus sp. fls2-241-R2A-57]|uniref:DUF262 domain-containing protein n=1 Tax=Lysinibacillus sp. fls2-241-R2A-57 TaxID=3040292 RepID=UPI00255439BB|nr:DUF262 domain-containing protein [Lysinibacillus sp. fls2-241-R2A-57]